MGVYNCIHIFSPRSLGSLTEIFTLDTLKTLTKSCHLYDTQYNSFITDFFIIINYDKMTLSGGFDVFMRECLYTGLISTKMKTRLFQEALVGTGVN